MKRRLRRVFPWMFSDDHEVTAYMGNQRRIMNNQERIMRHMGVEPCGDTETLSNMDQTNSKKSSILSQVAFNQRRLSLMRNYNIAPIVVAVLGAVKLILQSFNIDVITDEQINAIANGAAAIAAVVGIMVSPKKASTKQSVDDQSQYYH
ncbi:hypothetical protein [Paenibacillus taiwanensis]|uniref:hypothetical protein n=1 Tax=Paenibacillus taiwanensis TaxID=401638 RepID=UPI001B7FAE3C|nr:hypothetical protein [Paenibacillus taiwanensis]